MLCTCLFILVTTESPDIAERMKNNDSSVTLTQILMSDKAKGRCIHNYYIIIFYTSAPNGIFTTSPYALCTKTTLKIL